MWGCCIYPTSSLQIKIFDLDFDWHYIGLSSASTSHVLDSGNMMSKVARSLCKGYYDFCSYILETLGSTVPIIPIPLLKGSTNSLKAAKHPSMHKGYLILKKHNNTVLT